MARVLTPRRIGVAAMVVILVAGIALFNRERLVTSVADTETIQIAFERQYRLSPYSSKVKVRAVPVGVVTRVEPEEDGGVVVDVAVDPGTRARLGTEPSARIRPTTLLGGTVFIDLTPGGERDRALAGAIPTERTSVPVELDAVLSALQPDARAGLTTTVTEVERTLTNGGDEAVSELLERAPDTLEPAGRVLDAATGRGPSDLTDLVDGLAVVGREVTSNDDRASEIARSAGTVATALSDVDDDLAATVADLPATLRTTRSGLDDLTDTLALLRDTAPDAQAAVRALDGVVTRAEETLPGARSLVADLRPTVADLRPALGDLAPLVPDATAVGDDVTGPVLDRVLDPIVPTLLANYQGSETRLYQELGYMIAGVGGASKTTDPNGAMLSFQPGVGLESVGGLPIAKPPIQVPPLVPTEPINDLLYGLPINDLLDGLLGGRLEGTE